MITWLLSLFTGGTIGRILKSIDHATDAGTEREKARLAALQEFARNQVAMASGPGKWLLWLFALPIGLHTASVYVYSMLWCRDCLFPQGWTIAAPPPPYGTYTEWVIISLFGYGAFMSWNAKR
jgi:hypothetical protein